jgi:hypothetical protein
MNNTEQLLIRACKSKNKLKRLNSVYKRQYCIINDNDAWANKAIILINLVTKYYPIETIKLVDALNPHNALYYVKDENNYTYYEHLVGVLASHVSLAPVAKLEGYKVPAFFRNKLTH